MNTNPFEPARERDASVQASEHIRLQRDVVHALYGQSQQGIVVGFALAALFTLLFFRLLPSQLVWAWFAAMLVCCTTGYLANSNYRLLALTPAALPAQQLLLLFSLQGWFKAGLLGWMGWLFYSPEFGELRWVTVLAVCALAAGTVTSYAYHLPTYWGFLALTCLPLWLKMSLTGGMGGWGGHVVFASYLLALIGFARNQARVLLESIRIRHENTHLVSQLRIQTNELEQANAAKTQFFAAASHDLRQPLQALRYFSTLLQPHAADAPHVQRIRECVDSLDGLLEGVMTISRLDAGKVQSHLEAVDLSTLMQRLVTLYSGIAHAKGLRLRARLRASPLDGPATEGRVWVRTDPLLMERVMGNLVSNALRYTENGGVLLAARAWRGGVRLQVIDTGIGIAAEQQGSIFEEFVQLNNPQRDDNQGVGLGLATVQRLCKLLDHPLALRSQPGRGSAFSLVLPATAPAAPIPLPTVAGSQLMGRVLLVEDNDLVRESLQQTLQGWGLQVQAFAGAPAALQALANQRFDVVLSDWRLPGSVNGLDLLAQCSPLQAAPCLCVLMTGEPVDSLGTMPPGMTLLQKPVRPIRLRALLTAHLSQGM